MRVALLNPCFWPETRRGSERFARDLADGLLARGHEPRLITSHPGRRTRAIEEGLPIVRVWRPPDARLRRRRYEEHLTHVPLAYRELRCGGDDVAHALYPTDALAAARWSRRTGRPAIMSYMGIPHRQGLANRRLRVDVLMRALRGTRAVVALSAAAAAGFERWLGVQARVIAPGVDLDAFCPGGERAAEPTILCAADVTEPRKRVGLLLAAFALVRQERSDARLVLSRPSREGALDPRLAGALRADGVQLADLDDRAALVAANRAAWVAALPSVGEAFGLVVAEALACGTPAVVSDREALPELVDSPRIGRCFAGDDPQALAGALLEGLALSEDPATAVACRARVSGLSLDRTVDAYLDLYREVGADAD